MNRAPFASLAVVITFVAVACGSSDSGSGVPGVVSGPPVASADLPTAGANAICSGLSTCCAAGKFAYDDVKCHSTYVAELQKTLADSAALAGVTYDAAAAGTCIATLQSAYSTCSTPDSEGDAIEAACNAVFVGSLAAGAVCTDSMQCAVPAGSAAFCSKGATDAASVCVVHPVATHGKAGDSCAGTCGSPECDNEDISSDGMGTTETAICFVSEGLYCDNTNKCAAVVATGGTCDGDIACLPGGFCDLAMTKCAPFIAIGGMCNQELQCADGAYCDATTSMCAAYVAPGAACTDPRQCKDGDCQDGKCTDPNAIANTNSCATNPEDDGDDSTTNASPGSN